MSRDRWFWLLLPLFIFLSGNFSPLRIGPVLPIFILFSIYLTFHVKDIFLFFAKNKFTLLIFVCYSIFEILWSAFNIIEFSIDGSEFLGAVNPLAYILLSYIRICLCLFFMIALFRNASRSIDLWSISMTLIYWLLFLTTTIQFVSYFLFNVNIGYIFFPASGVRYGGFIGEPQTLSAWLFCCFYVLYTLGEVQRRHYIYQSILIASLLVSLVLTQSTVWIIATALFLLIRFNRFLILGGLATILALSSFGYIYEKIIADIFQVSERSITYIGGFEFFSEGILNILFGYGLGLSPYLLVKSFIFSVYPEFDLSDIGRQTVMNSYLENIFEIGILGFILFITLIFNIFNIKNIKIIIAISPILVGISSISGGFTSGYFLLSIPLLVYLKKLYFYRIGQLI